MPGTRYHLARGRRAGHSLWERAGENAGEGARTLFARLDASSERAELASADPARGAELASARLEALAALVRGGEWSDDLDALLSALELALAGRH